MAGSVGFGSLSRTLAPSRVCIFLSLPPLYQLVYWQSLFYTCSPVSQVITQSANQSFSQSGGRSVIQTVSQTDSQTVNQSAIQSVGRSFSQSISSVSLMLSLPPSSPLSFPSPPTQPVSLSARSVPRRVRVWEQTVHSCKKRFLLITVCVAPSPIEGGRSCAECVTTSTSRPHDLRNLLSAPRLDSATQNHRTKKFRRANYVETAP